MTPELGARAMSEGQRLDRHALAMAIWLSLGLVAAALFSYGFGAGGELSILLAFAALIAAIAGHVIVNAFYRTTFTARELALGLVLYAAGLVAFGLAVILGRRFADQHLVAMSVGFLALFAAVLFYMITHFGVRWVFEAFDVISDFRPGEERSGADRKEDAR